jgi:hypothetical protein
MDRIYKDVLTDAQRPSLGFDDRYTMSVVTARMVTSDEKAEMVDEA